MSKKWLAALLTLCLTILSCTSGLAAGGGVAIIGSSDMSTGVALDLSESDEQVHTVVAAKSGTTITSTNYIQSVAVADGKVYIMDSNELLSYTPGDTSLELIMSYEGMYYSKETLAQLSAEELDKVKSTPAQIISKDGVLWGLSDMTGVFGPLVDGLITDGVQLDWDDMYTEYGVRSRESAIVSGDGLFMLLSPENMSSFSSDDMTVYRFDLTTGEKIETVLTGSYELAPYKDGKLLAYEKYAYDEEGGVCVYNPQTNMIEETIIPIKPYDAEDTTYGLTYEGGGMAYDAQTDSIYYVDASIINKWNTDGAPTECALAQISYASNISYAAIIGENYLFNSWDGLYIRSLRAEDQPEQVLTIGGGYETDAVKAYRKANPDVAIVFDSNWYYGAEAVQADMLSGASGTDVYAMNLMSGVPALIEKGYVQDLSSSEILTESVSRMYPQFADVLTRDGKIYAFPYQINVNAWSINKTAWDQFDLGELPVTMLDVINAMQTWMDDYADDNPQYMLLDYYGDKSQIFGMALSQYIAQYDDGEEPLKFDTPAFRETMQAIENLDIEEPEEDETFTGGYTVVYSSNDDYVTQIINWSFTQVIEDDRYWYNSGDEDYEIVTMAPPVFEEGDEPVTTASMSVYFVNPNSPNIELATAFLEFIAQHNDPAVDYMLHPDLSEPVRASHYESMMRDSYKYLDELKKLLEEAEDEETKEIYVQRFASMEANLKIMEEDWLISEQSIAEYRELAPTISVQGDSEIMNYTGAGMQVLGDVFQRYMDGQITLDNTIRELDQKLRMIYLEGK